MLLKVRRAIARIALGIVIEVSKFWFRSMPAWIFFLVMFHTCRVSWKGKKHFMNMSKVSRSRARSFPLGGAHRKRAPSVQSSLS